MKKIFLYILFLSLAVSTSSQAQEYICNVKILGSKIQTVDPSVFKTLESSLTNFLNSQRWTPIAMKEHEKIKCNYIITLDQVLDEKNSMFKGSLSISASRPVYMTDYSTPLFTYVDNSFTFRYLENQPIQFNELQISGGDPLVDNLSAEFAFYSYLLLGMYFDSFKDNGGVDYYNKARNVVNNAPKDASITGWTAESSNKNSRYWVIDDYLNPRMKDFHGIWYEYHRALLDNMYSGEEETYSKLTDVVNNFSKLYTINASSKIVEIFLSTKGNEIYDLIASAPEQDVAPLADKMSRMHLVRYRDYQKLMNGGR